MVTKKKKNPKLYKNIPCRCRHFEDGKRCGNIAKRGSFFCENHGANALTQTKEQLLEKIVKNNVTNTRYQYTLPEFQNFVEKECDKLPQEQLNMYEELAILKSQVQFFLLKLEEAKQSEDDKLIMVWTNRLNNHIGDTIKQANRVWQMQQTNQNIPAIHVLAILNQIQNEARSYISEQQLSVFDEKLKQIKIGIGDIRNDDEGITREDLKDMIMSIPKPEDNFIDV